MKQLKCLFHPTALTGARAALSSVLVAVAAVLLASSALPARAQSTDDSQPPPQVERVLQLLANFHGALSYGGNLTAMMNLWADDSSLTLNGSTYTGKPAVQSFFANGGPFHHNWVSLAPEYKTQITFQGVTATATTQCVFVDVDPSSPTFHKVLSVIQVNATLVFQNGTWLFQSMNNTSGAPL